MYNTSNSGENRVRGDKMKQDQFSKILKTKGFYLSLLTGVLAIVAICFVYFNTSNTNKQNNNVTDLNENSAQQQVGENSQEEQSNTANQPGEENNTNVAQNTAEPNQEVAQNNVNNDALLENEVEGEPSDKIVDANQEANEDSTSKEDSVATVNQKQSTKLSFDQEQDLLWPVSGNIIIPYDVEHGVRFETLGQYKYNDAVMIESEIGTEVKSAAKCKIVSIEENEETGTTITTDVGDGYSIIYGQLDNLKVKKGDVLDAGEVIGTVAKPTKYYVVEGPNLYFKVMQDEQSVNPMYMLE